jgi:ABC-type branched-subunit amino acid transport system ATPase component
MSPSNRDTDDVAARLHRIQTLIDQLKRLQADSAEARKLALRIQREVEIARAGLKIVNFP